jgi:hypothetical protein
VCESPSRHAIVGKSDTQIGNIMVLSNGDMFALLIALFTLNTVLVLAFRRVAVLEKQVIKLRRELRK